DGQPVAVPVNYTVLDDQIVVRTGPGGKLAAAERGDRVGFEIEGLDFRYHEGWSVLAKGVASVVSDPARVERLRALPLRPWSGDGRAFFTTVTVDGITGRRVVEKGRL